MFSPNYPFPYQVWSDRLTLLTWWLFMHRVLFKLFHPIFSIKKESMQWLTIAMKAILPTILLFPAADSMSLLHLRNARLAELGKGCPCFWQVWHSLRKDGQVSTTWTMIFRQNIHSDLDYWLRLAVLMKIQCSLNCESKLRIGEYRENLDRCTDGYVKVYIQVIYMLLQKSGGIKVIKSL